MQDIVSSQRQDAIYHTFDTTDANLLIQSVAGSGKTTTLIGIMGKCVYRTLFLAFNKSIQEEVTAKVEALGWQHVKALTLHSLGLSAIKYKWGRYTIQKGKNYELIKALKDYNRSLYQGLSWEDKVKLNMTLMEMNDVSRIYLTDDLGEIAVHMTNMDRYFYMHDRLPQLWEDLLSIREDFEQRLIIDYIDMIYLVCKYELPIPIQPYYLMIDEAQDLNLAQHRMIDMLLVQGDIKKWVAVGDRRQAIYGFSGSYSTSFDLFKEKGVVYELPLDVCYRCPQAIIKEANKVYDVIEPFKEYEGIVETITDVPMIKEGSMVICRNTSPLIEVYFQLIGYGYKAYIKGEDIMGRLMNFLRPYEYKSVRQTMHSLRTDMLHIKEKPNKSDEDRYKYYRINENLTNLKLLQEHYCKPEDKISTIIVNLKAMFAEEDDRQAVTLCTIHKSKGLEADVVYILNEFLIPSKFAKSASQLEQERNLKYVARTRAKEEMYYLNIGEENEEV